MNCSQTKTEDWDIIEPSTQLSDLVKKLRRNDGCWKKSTFANWVLEELKNPSKETGQQIHASSLDGNLPSWVIQHRPNQIQS